MSFVADVTLLKDPERSLVSIEIAKVPAYRSYSLGATCHCVQAWYIAWEHLLCKDYHVVTRRTFHSGKAMNLESVEVMLRGYGRAVEIHQEETRRRWGWFRSGSAKLKVAPWYKVRREGELEDERRCHPRGALC
jgi:hypothetical protein